jgi:hypothetical protein
MVLSCSDVPKLGSGVPIFGSGSRIGFDLIQVLCWESTGLQGKDQAKGKARESFFHLLLRLIGRLAFGQLKGIYLVGSRAVRRVFLDGLGLEHRFGEGDALGELGFQHWQGQLEQAQFAPGDCGITRID